MQTIHLTYPVTDAGSFPRQVLAIGDFDGVHLGHREVIQRAVDTAKRLNVASSIMTFHPHPRQVLGHTKYVQVLSPFSAKTGLIEQMGVDTTYIVTFDPAFMQVTPQQFVEQMLIPMNVEEVIVGFDFTFGYKGEGNPDMLCELAKGRFAVEIVRAFHKEGAKVSSTRIREHLLLGDARQAAALLGRPHRITGEVVHGEARGRTIGFPTANISLSEPFVVPAKGVYAVKVLLDGTVYNGVMNIGVKPTFNQDEVVPTIEVHILDFDGTIYGKRISVDVVDYIRAERKFASVDELIAQIRRDADTGRTILSSL
ncbi:bifunctional riboflavin kinase/FAD synthetase [Paenibacillus thalictri]|uniref:Riboflavin biosynthesis protein n=1 Tax=Paenibacillus thalictri TaxID=2527873 RepID=A0A4Q9DSC6_9BACL|nr:bifunctional riboflavin kinase/FAD synthetase [Paenibacillus thalictri]TBL77775.1 bifunctional riboflavin kinase/FAD synthetase [Paenibacillus thalictri]